MRRLLDRLFRLGALACALLACGVLVGIAVTIAVRAWPALAGARLGAGVAGQGGAASLASPLLGTAVLVLTALAVSVPPALALALLRTVYLGSAAARRLVDVTLYTLNGVPSIVFGIVGLLVFVKALGWGKSWLAGGLVLGVMILPTLTVALAERLAAVPASYRLAAAGLGLTRSQTVWSVLLPQSLGGLVSGALLGLARAAGETAPIMFTAVVFAGAGFPGGIRESPVLALPYHIFVLAQDSFDPAAGAQMWGAALVLLCLVFALSLAALPARLRAHEEARHG